MTAPQENQAQPSDKEINFRLQEKAIAEKYERILAQERSEKDRLSRELQERSKPTVEDDDESDPYVDHKKLEKKLARFGENTMKQTQSEIQKAVHTALNEERKQNWIKQNGDFYDVLQHAEKLYQKDPGLAESILDMPEGFERQKLVYKSIKALGIDKPAVPVPSIQDKVDANRRSPFYHPTGVGNAPYTSQGDFSSQGQKQAYEKMQALKKSLRI
jgi:hypothetical protein